MAIINNNVENVKFLRNQTPFESREAARTALESNKGIAADGTALLARYTITDGQTTDVKTLVGFVAEVNSTKYVTIFDVEGGSEDVEKLRQEINAKLGDGITSANTATAQLATLSGTAQDTSASTSVAGAKAYAKDYTDEQIGELEYTGVTTGDGKVIVNVTETDGKVSGITAEVGGLKLTDYSKGSDSGAVVTTDSINQAISKLENQVDAANDKIDNAISGLDYSDTAVAKSFVIEVDETDGVIAVQRGTISSSAETMVLADNADGGVNFEVNIDNDTIVQDETTKKLKVASAALTQYVGDENTIHISAVDPTDNTKTISSPLTIQKVTTGLSEEVKEEYHLVGASGTTIGDPVKIYKDSHIVSITYITDTGDTHYQNLEYVYLDASGATKTEYVDISMLVLEAEFASGLTIENHVARGVVDPQSEKDSQETPVDFLTVGADGFKISGIKDEIDRKLNAIVDDLDATVTGATSGSHITISIEETDGKLVQSGLTIEENDIASASDLAGLSAKTVTNLTSANSSIAIGDGTAQDDGTIGIDIVTDASKIKMSGFTAAESGFTAITEASTVTEAVKAIETEVIANEETVAAALTDLDTRMDNLESDVQTISGNVNTISGDVDTIKGQYISGVSVNGHDVTVADKVAPISITAATSAVTATSTEAIVVDTDANGNITLGLATIDCGTY